MIAKLMAADGSSSMPAVGEGANRTCGGCGTRITWESAYGWRAPFWEPCHADPDAGHWPLAEAWERAGIPS